MRKTSRQLIKQMEDLAATAGCEYLRTEITKNHRRDVFRNTSTRQTRFVIRSSTESDKRAAKNHLQIVRRELRNLT